MRRPTTTTSSSSSYTPWYHHIFIIFLQYSLFHISPTFGARNTVTEGGQPLTELLSSLDQPYPCGHVVEAEHFLSTAVALKFPRLIQLAHFFANHSKNFDPQLLDKSSFQQIPPFDVSFARRTHFYGLQLNCTGNNHR